jgi:DNA-binding response OmpR family regulator
VSVGCRACGRPLPPKGVLAIDPKHVAVMLDGKTVRVNNAEFLLLERLARGPGLVAERHLEAAASLQEGSTRGLAVHIWSLRKKVGRDRIVNVPKRGYRLAGPFRFTEVL